MFNLSADLLIEYTLIGEPIDEILSPKVKKAVAGVGVGAALFGAGLGMGSSNKTTNITHNTYSTHTSNSPESAKRANDEVEKIRAGFRQRRKAMRNSSETPKDDTNSYHRTRKNW